MKLGFLSGLLIGLTCLCCSAAAADKKPAARSPSHSERFETPPLRGEEFDASAMSVRTRGANGVYTLENVVCNRSTDLGKTLVFDWPEAAFFTHSGGPVPANTCKVLVRQGVVDTETDDKSNILLTTQKIPFAATTYRRKRDKTDVVLDWVATTLGMRPWSPGPAANGTEVRITTYYQAKRVELVIENSSPDGALYLSLPPLSEQARSGLIRQLEQQGQAAPGSTVATREAMSGDFRPGEERDAFNQFMGRSTTHVIRLVMRKDYPKAQLVWPAVHGTGTSVRWSDLPVVMTQKQVLSAGFSYAAPDGTE